MEIKDLEECLNYKNIKFHRYYYPKKYEHFKTCFDRCVIYLRQNGFKLEKDSVNYYLTGKSIQGFKLQFIGNSDRRAKFYCTFPQQISIIRTSLNIMKNEMDNKRNTWD